MPKVLVLGLGNDLLTDDAVGLQVAFEASRQLLEDPAIEVKSTLQSGAALLDLMVGYDALVVVDAIQTGAAQAGHLHVIAPETVPAPTERWSHSPGILETCALGRSLGFAVPRIVRIVAIEVADPFTLGVTMTAAVEQAVGPATVCVVECARALARGDIHPSEALHPPTGPS